MLSQGETFRNAPRDINGCMQRLRGAVRVLVDATTEHAGDLWIDAGRVVDAPTADDLAGVRVDEIDVSGCVVTPGLVNAHHHLLQSGFRTLPATRGVPMREWLPAMASAYAAAGIDPSLTARTAAVGMAESLLSGVTTVADHQLNWPRPGSDPAREVAEIAGAIAAVSRELGARLAFVRGTARDDAGIAAEGAEAIVETLLRVGHERGVTDDGMLQIAVGPAGVHSDGEATFRRLGEVAARHGLRRRTQANEQVDTEIALERYGRRPLDLLEEWGWLDEGVTIAHLCDVTTSEIDRLAAAGVTATHAPGCDVPMGWGVAPVAALQAGGVVVGLGTSGGGSNDAGHLLADARLAMQVSGLVGAQLSARTVLAMATEGGATGLGRDDIGHLRAGARADVCVWDVSGVADAGVADPVAGLLWASPGRRPRDVFVGGAGGVRDGRLLTADEATLVAGLRARIAG